MNIRQPENIAITIPENKTEIIASIGLGIKIKSFVDTPFLLQVNSYIPEIVRDGEVLEAQTHINTDIENNICNWQLLTRGFHGEVNQDFQVEVYWQNDLLNLKISTIVLWWEKYVDYISWTFQGLKPRIYQLRFIYQNTSQEQPLFTYEDYRLAYCNEPLEIFTDTLTTDLVDIDLLEPIKSKINSVEVDGIVFKNLIPYTEIS